MFTPTHAAALDDPLHPLQGREEQAFSLIELLVVIGLMGLLMSLAMPAFSSMQGAGNLSKAASDIQGVMEQARSYAMANNTYVYVGIEEVDGMNPTAAPGIGRVAIAVVASKDGTRPYPQNPNTPGPLNTTNIFPLGKALYFDNLHMTNTSSLSSVGNMTRPPAVVDLGSNNSATTFYIPINAISGAAKYSFTNVVEFDPQGVPRCQTNNSAFEPSIQNYLEIPLVPAHGNVAMSNSANQAAVQIDGVTGAARTYRP